MSRRISRITRRRSGSSGKQLRSSLKELHWLAIFLFLFFNISVQKERLWHWMNLHPKYRGRRDVEDQRRPKKQLTTLGSREEKYIKRFEQLFSQCWQKKTLPKMFNSFASSFNFICRQGVKSQTHLGYWTNKKWQCVPVGLFRHTITIRALM